MTKERRLQSTKFSLVTFGQERRTSLERGIKRTGRGVSDASRNNFKRRKNEPRFLVDDEVEQSSSSYGRRMDHDLFRIEETEEGGVRVQDSGISRGEDESEGFERVNDQRGGI